MAQQNPDKQQTACSSSAVGHAHYLLWVTICIINTSHIQYTQSHPRTHTHSHPRIHRREVFPPTFRLKLNDWPVILLFVYLILFFMLPLLFLWYKCAENENRFDSNDIFLWNKEQNVFEVTSKGSFNKLLSQFYMSHTQRNDAITPYMKDDIWG